MNSQLLRSVRSSGRRCGSLLLTLRVGCSCVTCPVHLSAIFTTNNIEQSTLRWGEAKTNDNKRELLGCVVRELVEEHVEALFNIIKPIWGFILIIGSATLLYSTRLGTGYTCAQNQRQ
jgi:hypothetical protein